MIEKSVVDFRMRRVEGALQRWDADQERRIVRSSECPLGNDANRHQAEGMLQQRGAKEKQRARSMGSTSSVTGPQPRCPFFANDSLVEETLQQMHQGATRK